MTDFDVTRMGSPMNLALLNCITMTRDDQMMMNGTDQEANILDEHEFASLGLTVMVARNMVASMWLRTAAIFTILILTALNVSIFVNRNAYAKSSDFMSQPAIFGKGIIDNFDKDVYHEASEEDMNELDECYHVYLDVGSNIGNQVRKLYQPHLFINASFLQVFGKYFGDFDDRPTVCAVGFEPNPRHAQTLESIQSAYQRCGWKVKFFTKTAAAHSYGLATFYSDENEVHHEWGGSILESRVAKKPAGVTKMIRLADYIMNKVVKRRLPSVLNLDSMDRKPNVVMKLDIEGSELEVLTDLLVTGALSHIDMAAVEYHATSFGDGDVRSPYIEGLEKAVDTLVFLSKTLRLKSELNVVSFDDESYGSTEFPLPVCSRD